MSRRRKSRLSHYELAYMSELGGHFIAPRSIGTFCSAPSSHHLVGQPDREIESCMIGCLRQRLT
eukprot:3800245-Pleurochrysis_carterae.AAC.1